MSVATSPATNVSSITPTHQIKITLRGNLALPPDPLPFMRVGETVRYFSDEGEVRIEFPERSPFRTDNQTNTSIPGGIVVTLLSESGDAGFPCRCHITPPNGQEVGWAPNAEASGGVHKVGGGGGGH
jgi:hypothetical protein